MASFNFIVFLILTIFLVEAKKRADPNRYKSLKIPEYSIQ